MPGHGNRTDLLPPLGTISLGTTRNRMCGGLFADAHGDETRNDHLILRVPDLDERLGGVGVEPFETLDGLLSRGESADGVDCEVGGEFVKGWGERVGPGCHG